MRRTTLRLHRVVKSVSELESLKKGTIVRVTMVDQDDLQKFNNLARYIKRDGNLLSRVNDDDSVNSGKLDAIDVWTIWSDTGEQIVYDKEYIEINPT